LPVQDDGDHVHPFCLSHDVWSFSDAQGVSVPPQVTVVGEQPISDVLQVVASCWLHGVSVP
jgi:hypothetical protein